MIDKYVNFDLRLADHEVAAGGEHFSVQVEGSAMGAAGAAERVGIAPGFRDRLLSLERREFDHDDSALIALGIEIGELLLPPNARKYFSHSRTALAPRQGLRIRIRCSALALDRIPWEFAHVDLGLDSDGAAVGRRGFLAGNKTCSVVRYELGSSLGAPVAARADGWRLLAVACEPADRRDPDNPLQLDAELANLRDALADSHSIDVVACRPPTRAAMHDLLLQPAEIFHFAGHGEFTAAAAATERGEAWLLLELGDGSSDKWQVDELAQRLAGRGIQLAVLGACRSAERGTASAWSGVAQSLAREGIPAVIGMQFTVFDPSAIAFSRMLYRAWARGCELEEAVAEARGAIADIAGSGRDFATPVLYLRSESLRVPVAAGPNKTLQQIAQLYDYKLVHDALHSARSGPFSLIQLRCQEFPAGTTAREIGQHARDLRMRLQDVRRVAEQGRCDMTVMQEVIDEFAAAIAFLEKALAERAVESLEDAVAAFDSLLSTQPARIDVLMTVLAKGLALGPLVDFLRALGVPVSAQVADEMIMRGERLVKGAAMHSTCQSIDNRLALIRRAAEAQRFREIRRQWKSLSDSLTRILPDWTADGGDRLRQNTLVLDRGIAANDAVATDAVFDDFCGDFDFGFYTVDSDFKQLCGEMKERTTASLAGAGALRLAAG